MKTSILLTIIMMTIASFELHHSEIEAKEKIGLQVISALQRASADEFQALFPTLSDFHALMQRNSELYGKNFTEAAREFEDEFRRVVYPEFSGSFQRILEEGRRAGIDWRTIQFVAVESAVEPREEFSVVPITIVFQAQGKTHRLHVEKALMINGHWKISQYLRLE